MQRARDRRSVCRSRWGASGRRRLGVVAVAVAIAAAMIATIPASAQAQSCPWLNSSQPIAQRVAELMSQMTVADEDLRRRGSRHGQRAAHSGGQSVRVLDAGHRVAVHPSARRGGRARGRRRRPQRRHPAARRRGPRGHVRSVAGPAVRPGDRLRGVRQGRGGQPRADDQHRPRPAVGPVVRGVHRGPVPERVAGHERDRRRAEHRRDVAGQALRGLQPGDQPQHAAATT